VSAPRVAVIGGGAAGMLAALRAAERGAEVVLIEAGPALGGVIRTVREGPWLAEVGPNTVMEPDAVVRGLLDRAGLANRVVRPGTAAKRRYIVHGGVPTAVPGSASELLSTPLVSVSGRLRLLKEPFIAPSAPGAEETVDAFARRRFGDEIAERFFDPLLAGTSGADPTQLLMRYAFPKLLEYEQLGGSVLKGARRAASAARAAGRSGTPSLGLWSCPDGLSEIPTTIARHLGDRVRLGAEATVQPTPEGFLVSWGGGEVAVDAVIVAVPAPALARVAGALPGGDALATTAAMPHATLVSLSLGFRRDAVAHPIDGFGVLAPSGERRAVLGVLFPSAIFANRAPDGHVLLTSFVGGMRRPDLVTEPPEVLERIVREDLASLLGVRGEPVFRHEARWTAALPQAVAGHAQRLAAAAAVETAEPRVAFAGNWHDGLSVGDAMLGGVHAVDRLATRGGWS
jgi:oxygen-dependent protoporphyrinogen oxidase